MKAVLTLFSAIAVTCALAMPAAAQYITQQMLNNFNAFLNGHPQVAQELYRNPNLVNSADYLEARPDLHYFLENNDALRRAIQTHPGQFMYQGGRYSYGWGRGGWNPAWSHEPSREEWERLHNYGYTDPDDHQWHDREWWEQERGDWVRKHNPKWEAAGRERRQDYDRWRAQQQQRNAQQQRGVHEQQQRNVQQQRAVHQQNQQDQQRQAMHEQQQRNVQQQEAVHQQNQQNQQQATTRQESQQLSHGQQQNKQHGNGNDKP
jgi:hypothetical protein